MGLDWNPGPAPLKGTTEEFEKLWRSLKSKWCWNRRGKMKRLDEITRSAFETLSTPRVGVDPKARDWARTAFEHRADKALSFDSFLHEMHGFYVLDLVPPCDGIPRYSNGSPGGYVERTSFRAQFLVDCTAIIGDDLLAEAYESKLRRDTGNYGEALLTRVQEFAERQRIDLSTVDAAEDPETIEFRCDVVLAAGRWCRFWASKGHWLEADW